MFKNKILIIGEKIIMAIKNIFSNKFFLNRKIKGNRFIVKNKIDINYLSEGIILINKIFNGESYKNSPETPYLSHWFGKKKLSILFDKDIWYKLFISLKRIPPKNIIKEINKKNIFFFFKNNNKKLDRLYSLNLYKVYFFKVFLW